MSDGQKQNMAANLHRFAGQKIIDGEQIQPQEYPCHVTSINGQFVEVAFDVNWTPFTLPKVTMPKAHSNYFIEPTQVGDKGIAIASDLYVGGQSEQGGGVASRYKQANLSTLLFQPVTRKSWTGYDVNLAYAQGPNGAVLQSVDGTYQVSLTKAGGLVVKIGGTVLCTIKAGIVYLGGDGAAGTYNFVQTTAGPALAVKARTA